MSTPTAKKKINASAFITDVKAHVPESILSARYGISIKQVTALKNKLVDQGHLDESFRSHPWTCPKCGYDTVSQPSECPRCGLILTLVPVVEKKAAARAEQARRKAADTLPWLSVGVQYLQIIGIAYLALAIHWGAAVFFGMILWLIGRAILYYDKTQLAEDKLDTSGLETWWLVFTPLYIKRRAALVNGDYWPFRVDMLLAFTVWCAVIFVIMVGLDQDLRGIAVSAPASRRVEKRVRPPQTPIEAMPSRMSSGSLTGQDTQRIIEEEKLRKQVRDAPRLRKECIDMCGYESLKRSGGIDSECEQCIKDCVDRYYDLGG